MSRNFLVQAGLASILFASILCDGDKGNPAGPTTNGKQAYGTIKVSLVTVDEDSFTSFQGTMYDGPTPSTTIWELVATDNGCKLLKPRTPNCTTSCGSQAACVEDNICQPYPLSATAGKLTITGLKTNAGATTINIDPSGANYLLTGGVKLAYPPCNEGDAVSLTASGDSVMSGFALNVKGISPLTVLNNNFTLADGQPIVVNWVPAAQTTGSTIFILIDLSYHGGTKAKIECECADNGSLTIPASLLGSLKAFGTSGFPKIEISRRAIGTDPKTNVKIILESKITMLVNIPDHYSCNSNDECPDGTTCKSDHECRP